MPWRSSGERGASVYAVCQQVLGIGAKVEERLASSGALAASLQSGLQSGVELTLPAPSYDDIRPGVSTEQRFEPFNRPRPLLGASTPSRALAPPQR